MDEAIEMVPAAIIHPQTGRGRDMVFEIPMECGVGILGGIRNESSKTKRNEGKRRVNEHAFAEYWKPTQCDVPEVAGCVAYGPVLMYFRRLLPCHQKAVRRSRQRRKRNASGK